MSRVKGVILYPLKCVSEADGSLVPIDLGNDVPFEAKRLFYVYGVPEGDKRGGHAHLTTKQLLICVNGRINVTCDDGNTRQTFSLDSPNKALYIPEMIWDECEYTLQNSILMVVSSTSYNPKDYIEDYDYFVGCTRESNKNM